MNLEVDNHRDVAKVLEDCLKWLLININLMLETRKEDLIKKRPGAVPTLAEPRLVWVQMVKCPSEFTDVIFSLAKVFNELLEATIAGDKHSHILKLHIEGNSHNFDRWGNLTSLCKCIFWKLLDDSMKNFDAGDTDFRPRKKHVVPACSNGKGN